MFSENNGQWIEVCGIPYFCPDNSPYYYDDLDDIEDVEDENTEQVIEFRKKCKMISRYKSLIKPLEFELESQTEIEFDEF